MIQQIVFARMREDFSPGFLPFELQKGEELPVDTAESILRNGELVLMKRDNIGIYSFGVPMDKCVVVKKHLTARFKPGDIVRKNGTDCVFRIYSVKWDRTDFWYQDAWGESQNFKSGCMESDVTIADDDEIERNASYIKYYDDLMTKRCKLFNELIYSTKPY